MAVYFIRPVGLEGPVKIGVSTMSWLRLEELMRWSPLPLEVVATLDGGGNLELRFHAKFKHLHSHKEWFKPDPELSATIADIQAGRFDVSTLPPGECVTQARTGKARSAEARRRIGVTARYFGAKRRGFTPPADLARLMDRVHLVPFAERESLFVRSDEWVITTKATG